jgi:hypothetical protein
MHSGSPEVTDLEHRYLRGAGARTYLDALAVFERLWALARQLNPDFPGPWQDDLAPDLELARVLNGLPKNP